MKILALEMSTARGGIALRADGDALFDCDFAADRKHSGAFFENVQLCLKRFGAPRQIVVGIGPGSYAGVRIAIAAALGLRSSTGAKLAGIPSICALDVEESEYCVIGDARRQSFFFVKIESGRLIEGPILESEAELQARLRRLTGPIFTSESLAQFSQVKLAYPSAGRLAEIAATQPGEIGDVESLEPIYLRKPHITVPKPVRVFASTNES
ncbi:MAG TPA: tRNA (adenosine(37)-N6)-threonylcarbamoyltransferase complex dimerization subunit type 1 TsaB [Chthoniobacterales bacterium]|jgi:tRNA threonylcarbamoyl adenosine modification protein YeaZ|nr:tRNA (adenosine(37)-N6)-threonylcarbamoyltransferase complex dimerization subunit type 1 TsaB [Chthoniobacterales bacterium]